MSCQVAGPSGKAPHRRILHWRRGVGDSEFEQVLQHWIAEATSPLGQIVEGLTPSAWVARNVGKWFRENAEATLSEVERSAAALRQEAERIGGWGKPELHGLMEELTQLQDGLGDLRSSLDIDSKEGKAE